jgi:hypothetical protein
MLFLKKRYDGGKASNVTGYWLFEIKNLCSIVVLKFEPSHRENFHSHAFNALTIWLKGEVLEERLDTYKNTAFKAGNFKYTPKENVHKIHCKKTAWCISFRGPWSNTWFEYNKKNNKYIELTHGRKIVGGRV